VEFIELVHRARLFVGGDTGPTHLAAAVGTPIVAIYGPTNPARNGPFAADDITIWKEKRAARAGGHAHWGSGRAKRESYIEGVAVEDVLAAAVKRLASGHEV
jgi:heptosyltransferase I